MIESDKTLAQALSKAKTPEAVRVILQERNITNIADDVVETLARTTNGKMVGNRILDKVKYLANFDELKWFGKFVQNPLTKVVGRVIGKLMIIGGVCLGVYEWIHANAEANEIE